MSTRRVPTLFVAFALLAVVLARGADAAPILLDFEAQANLEELTDQFALDQVLFQNAIVVEAFDTLNELDFPPTSGIHAITGNLPGPIVVDFVVPANLFIAQLTTADSAVVEIYSVGDVLLDSRIVVANLGSPTEVGFFRPGQDIDYLLIKSLVTASAEFLTVDDVVFAIPEPSAFLVMVAGLIPVSVAIRRRARA